MLELIKKIHYYYYYYLNINFCTRLIFHSKDFSDNLNTIIKFVFKKHVQQQNTTRNEILLHVTHQRAKGIFITNILIKEFHLQYPYKAVKVKNIISRTFHETVN